MTQVVDRNWYSPESKKAENEKDKAALKQMKSLETQYQSTRDKVTEETPFGIRTKYIKRE